MLDAGPIDTLEVIRAPLLVVAATWPEIKGLIEPYIERHPNQPYKPTQCRILEQPFDVLVTGVGTMATAAHVGRTLMQQRYRMVLNLGVAGSFREGWGPGTVVHVTHDRLGDLGAEDRDGGFLDAYGELGLTPPGAPEDFDGWLTPPELALTTLDALPKARGITVNMAHGTAASIEAVRRRFQPDTESMEGAACFYAAALEAVPCAQVRAISNRVEPRKREAWDIPAALTALHTTARAILEELAT